MPPGKKDLVDLKVIQSECACAMYVVGIIPIYQVQTRSRRLGAMKVNMTLSELLEAYFDTKPELKDRKSDLIEKTLALAQEDETQECC